MVYGKDLLPYCKAIMATYPKYLTKRKQGFYAVMEIPKALRPLFDMKPRFLQSLQTQELKIAERRIPIVVTRWKEQLEKAKVTSPKFLYQCN